MLSRVIPLPRPFEPPPEWVLNGEPGNSYEREYAQRIRRALGDLSDTEKQALLSSVFQVSPTNVIDFDRTSPASLDRFYQPDFAEIERCFLETADPTGKERVVFPQQEFLGVVEEFKSYARGVLGFARSAAAAVFQWQDETRAGNGEPQLRTEELSERDKNFVARISRAALEIDDDVHKMIMCAAFSAYVTDSRKFVNQPLIVIARPQDEMCREYYNHFFKANFPDRGWYPGFPQNAHAQIKDALDKYFMTSLNALRRVVCVDELRPPLVPLPGDGPDPEYTRSDRTFAKHIAKVPYDAAMLKLVYRMPVADLLDFDDSDFATTVSYPRRRAPLPVSRYAPLLLRAERSREFTPSTYVHYMINFRTYLFWSMEALWKSALSAVDRSVRERLEMERVFDENPGILPDVDVRRLVLDLIDPM